MASYEPGLVPEKYDPEWFRREFDKLLEANTRVSFRQLEPLAIAPPRPRTGLVVYADGTNWNPGSGEGVYVFKSTSAWLFLG